MAGNWAGALEALGAGLQGKGNEYMLVQEERKKRLDELDEKRLKAMAMDFNSSLSDLKSGNVGAAWERLLNRHEQIIKLGGDPTHTENLMGMLKSGDVNGAVSKLEQARAAAIQDGLLEAPDLKSKYTGIFTTEDGQRAGLNIETNQVEIIPGAENVRAPVGGDATNYSASDKTYLNGTMVRGRRDGGRDVMRPDGTVVTGAEAQKVLEKAMRDEIAFTRDKSAASAEGTTTGGGNAERLQERINTGVSASKALPVLYRARSLLDKLETGGVNAILMDAKTWFGLSTADESELTYQLGKLVIAQYKEVFGSAFSEKEGAKLDFLEAGLGKSTAGNKRIINQLIKMGVNNADTGYEAAYKSGDLDSAKYIRDMQNFTLDDSEPPPQGGQSLQVAPQNEDIPVADGTTGATTGGYEVGKTYADANGSKAVYMGGGNWKEIQ